MTISPKFRVDCGRDSRGYPHQCVRFVVAFATMYSSSDEEEALLFLVLEDEENSRRKKRKWAHRINVERKDFGEFHTLMPELRQDEKRFYIYFRMPTEGFDEILSPIKEDITKMDTNYREAISAEELLAITLRFLATGDSFSTVGHSFRVGFETVSQIVTKKKIPQEAMDICLF